MHFVLLLATVLLAVSQINSFSLDNSTQIKDCENQGMKRCGDKDNTCFEKTQLCDSKQDCPNNFDEVSFLFKKLNCLR